MNFIGFDLLLCTFSGNRPWTLIKSPMTSRTLLQFMGYRKRLVSNFEALKFHFSPSRAFISCFYFYILFFSYITPKPLSFFTTFNFYNLDTRTTELAHAYIRPSDTENLTRIQGFGWASSETVLGRVESLKLCALKRWRTGTNSTRNLS